MDLNPDFFTPIGGEVGIENHANVSRPTRFDRVFAGDRVKSRIRSQFLYLITLTLEPADHHHTVIRCDPEVGFSKATFA